MAYSIGKWTQETCKEMIEKLFSRVELPYPNNKIQIFSDGNDDYVFTLPEYYANTCIDYGQIVKIREKGRVVDKIKRIIFGNPDTEAIETTNIENFNGIMRERVGRLVRKTKCFSKKISRLTNATELIQFHWNFMDTIHDDSTPAMIESLSKGIWSWDDFLLFHYAV